MADAATMGADGREDQARIQAANQPCSRSPEDANGSVCMGQSPEIHVIQGNPAGSRKLWGPIQRPAQAKVVGKLADAVSYNQEDREHDDGK